MRSEQTRNRARNAARLRPEWLALGIAALACQGGDTQVGCSPTPSCSLRADRLGPREERDAGPPRCLDRVEHCQAEQVSAGAAHTCAVAMAGELVCFGDDGDGRLGLRARDLDAGAQRDAGTSPGDFVAIDEEVLQVSAGGAHTCALTASRRVVCFGRNYDGQVDGVASGPLAPTEVAVEGAMKVAAGAAHSCALTVDGVVCWGRAQHGQTGRGASDEPQAPALVPGTEGALEVATGVRHSCARLADERVLCWGELIDPASGEASVADEPTLVPGIDDALGLSAGAGHTCVMHRDRRVSCFGRNASGQLGDGSVDSRAQPVEVAVGSVLEVSAGGVELDGQLVGHTCVRTLGFQLSCWGRNTEGQLGIGRAPDSATPKTVLNEPGRDDLYLDELKGLAAGGLHTCGLEDDGEIVCFGDDRAGQRALRDDETPVFGRAQEARPFGGSR